VRICGVYPTADGKASIHVRYAPLDANGDG